MRIIILLAIIASLYSCKTTKIGYSQWNKSIQGKWELKVKSQVNYPEVEFTKGGAVFNSLADTIYGFACKMKNNYLILDDGEKHVTRNKIIKLTTDTLIFANLLEHSTPQPYIKKK